MNEAKKILVLNYHLLSDDDIPVQHMPDPLYSVRVSDFLHQMNLLHEKNIPVISLSDLVNDRFQEKFGVALTFDDGHFSDYQTVAPTLQALKFPATFFPFVNGVGITNRLSWEQLKELSEKGFDIGSHGISHTLFSELSREQQLHELKNSKNVFEEKLGKTVEHFSLPYGWYDKEILELAKTVGYRSMLTTGLKMNFPTKKPFVIHRWNIKRDTPIEKLETILENKGSLSLEEKFSAQLKSLTKKSLGLSFTNRLNVYISKRRKKANDE